MIKKIFYIGIIAVICLIGQARVEAGVVNSRHDMFAGGRGQDPNVCSYCHMPHKAAGDKIWSSFGNEAQLANGPSSPIGNMCYTCHDGTVTNRGQNTVFNAALQQHKTGQGSDCNICHTVHDNTNGNFLGISRTQSANTEAATYCETCHAGAMYPGAERHGDHLLGSEHPYRDAGGLLNTSCNSCHRMHGAANYTTQELTNPILKNSNIDSAYCAACHADKVQNAHGGNKHPANLAAAGQWGKVDCKACHDVHQPSSPARTAVLKHKNIDSTYCLTCHQAQDNADGPGIGQHSHPIGSNFVTIGLTPAANAIDDDSDGARDYTANSASIVCESCHSAHSKGVASPLLRITDRGGALCINCHNNI